MTDFEIIDSGSIVFFTPMNGDARKFLEEHTDGMWWGLSLAVEHRFAQDLARGLVDNNFTIKE